MSGYLTFYLVPKKTITKFIFDDNCNTDQEVKVSEGIPLMFMSYSRSSDIYQIFTENIYNIAYCSNYCSNEDNYTELTLEDIQNIRDSIKEDIYRAEELLKIDYKIIQGSICDLDMRENIYSNEKYIRDQKNVLCEINNIYNIVEEITKGFTNFEKVLININ